jgi:hypothetical protein
MPDTAEEVPNGLGRKRDYPPQSTVCFIAAIVKGMLYNALGVEHGLRRWANMPKMLH